MTTEVIVAEIDSTKIVGIPTDVGLIREVIDIVAVNNLRKLHSEVALFEHGSLQGCRMVTSHPVCWVFIHCRPRKGHRHLPLLGCWFDLLSSLYYSFLI